MRSTTRSREEMKNRPTSYEVVAVLHGIEHRIGFTPKRTKAALFHMAQTNKELILPHVEEGNDTVVYNRENGMWFGPYAGVKFSGKTERECSNRSM